MSSGSHDQQVGFGRTLDQFPLRDALDEMSTQRDPREIPTAYGIHDEAVEPVAGEIDRFGEEVAIGTGADRRGLRGA